jgi:hypothetical protein
MFVRKVSILAVMIGLVSLCEVAGARAETLPERKPGLWEMKVTSDSGRSTQSMKQCVDAATDAKMMRLGSGDAMKGACSRNEFRRTSAGYETTTECRFGGSTIQSEGSFTGDFSKAYVGQVKSSFAPPMFGREHSTTTISAKWLGACEQGMVPGDMITAQGIKINIDMMESQAKQMGALFAGGSAGADALRAGSVHGGASGGMDPKQFDAIKKALQQASPVD